MHTRMVVVIGAGNMGGLIAYLFAAAGFRVCQIDVNQSALDSARARHKLLSAQSALGEEEDLDIAYYQGDLEAKGDIRAALVHAELVIEAVAEEPAIKAQVFLTVEKFCSPKAVLASISSAIPIRVTTSGLQYQDRVCNMHFLQQGIAAVEVMRGPHTSDDTIARVTELLDSMGMIPFVLGKEHKGFIFNIIWKRIKQTCLQLIARGIATPEQIDRLWMLALKMPLGPIALMDLVGLHVVLAIEEEYARESGDPADLPPDFLRQMVADGKTGMRAGQGFYSYPSPRFRQPGFLEGALSDGVDAPPIRITRESFVRSWRLVRYSAETPEGSHLGFPMGEDVQGQLTYTPDGRVWVYLSQPSRAPFLTDDPRGGTIAEQAAAHSSCFFYSGTFAVGDRFVVHRIEQCSFPNWVGRNERRDASFEDGKLVLRTAPMQVGEVHAVQKLVWSPL